MCPSRAATAEERLTLFETVAWLKQKRVICARPFCPSCGKVVRWTFTTRLKHCQGILCSR